MVSENGCRMVLRKMDRLFCRIAALEEKIDELLRCVGEGGNVRGENNDRRGLQRGVKRRRVVEDDSD